MCEFMKACTREFAKSQKVAITALIFLPVFQVRSVKTRGAEADCHPYIESRSTNHLFGDDSGCTML